MAAMILYTVVIKEGALPKLREIVLIVTFGCKLTGPQLVGRADSDRLYFGSGMRPHLPILRHYSTSKLDCEIPQIVLNIARSAYFYFPPRKSNH